MKSVNLLLMSTLFLLLTSCSITEKTGRDYASVKQSSDSSSTLTNLRTLQRKLSQTASLNLVGRNGRISLFFLDDENLLNIVICESLSIITDGKNCNPAKGTSALKMELNTFLGHIALLMRASVDSFYNYRQTLSPKTNDEGETLTASEKKQLAKLKGFVERYNSDSLSYKNIDFLIKTKSKIYKIAVSKEEKKVSARFQTKYRKNLETSVEKLISETLSSLKRKITSDAVDDVLYERKGEETMLHGLLEFFVYNKEMSKLATQINEAQYQMTDHIFANNELKKVKGEKINSKNMEFDYIYLQDFYQNSFVSVFFEKKVRYQSGFMPVFLDKNLFTSKEECAEGVEKAAYNTEIYQTTKDYVCKGPGFSSAYRYSTYSEFAKKKGLEKTQEACIKNFDQYLSQVHYITNCRSVYAHKLLPSLEADKHISKHYLFRAGLDQMLISFLNTSEPDYFYRFPKLLEFLAIKGVSGEVKFISNKDFERLKSEIRDGYEVKVLDKLYVIESEDNVYQITGVDKGSKYWRPKLDYDRVYSNYLDLSSYIIREKRN